MKNAYSSWNTEGGKMFTKFNNAIIEYSKDRYIDGKKLFYSDESYKKALKTWGFCDFFENTDDFIEYRCCCGHIINNVYIWKNEKTDILINVGNCCVKKFAKDSEAYETQKKVIKTLKKLNEIKKTDMLPCRFANQCEKIYSDFMFKQNNFWKEEIEKNNNFQYKIKKTIVTFGKYKGMKYSEIPESYIKWYGENKKYSDFNNHLFNELYAYYTGKRI